MGIKIEFQSAYELQDFCQRFAKPVTPEVIRVEKQVYTLSEDGMHKLINDHQLHIVYKDKKVAFIKFIRALTGLSLSEAKALSEDYGV